MKENSNLCTKENFNLKGKTIPSWEVYPNIALNYII